MVLSISGEGSSFGMLSEMQRDLERERGGTCGEVSTRTSQTFWEYGCQGLVKLPPELSPHQYAQNSPLKMDECLIRVGIRASGMLCCKGVEIHFFSL